MKDRTMTLYKFSGAGNDFVIIDGRHADVSPYRAAERISALCAEHGTDGLMILGEAAGQDFEMEFYNPDGSGGMMCGNGGRCIVAFADLLGIRPAGDRFHFLAPDGPHTAQILSHRSDSEWTVRLRMKDVQRIDELLGGCFLDTGTRHFVKFVDDVEAVDVATEGKALRWREEFAPIGTNVNFVSADVLSALRVRTFEKGVEGETLACGTGLTASAIAAWHKGLPPTSVQEETPAGPSGQASARDGGTVISGRVAGVRLSYRLKARRDCLNVDFIPTIPMTAVSRGELTPTANLDIDFIPTPPMTAGAAAVVPAELLPMMRATSPVTKGAGAAAPSGIDGRSIPTAPTPQGAGIASPQDSGGRPTPPLCTDIHLTGPATLIWRKDL